MSKTIEATFAFEIVRLRAALASMVAHVRVAQVLGWREIDLAYLDEAADRADALLAPSATPEKT